MVTQLQPDVRAHLHGGEVIKRYYRQRVCAVCGSTYWPTHSQQKLCSEECQKQNHNEKSLEFYHKKQKEKSECKDLLQTKEPVSSTNSSEIITIPA